MRDTLTSDIGFAIRDLVEGMDISHVDAGEETEMSDRVLAIDISDADNPVFRMENGAQFSIRIVRTA